MARTYYNANNATYSKATEIQTAKPFDTRVVVDTFNDLLVSSTTGFKYAYTGLVVYVIDEQCQYVFTGTSAKASDIRNADKWVKLGGEDVDPEENLEYYQGKLGARIFESTDDLDAANIPFSYNGMFAVITSTSGSEDETGLYVLIDKTNNIWQQVVSGGVTPSDDTKGDVIVSDGSETPQVENGFVINSNKNAGSDENVFIQEDYADNGFEGGQYYTSRGLNTSDKNDADVEGSEFEPVDYIILTSGETGSESYIKLFSEDNENWIEIYIAEGDDSLGFTQNDVTYIDAEGNVQPMTSNPMSLPKETPISFGENDVDFTGMKETREGDVNEYIFGVDGDGYDNIDMYTSTTLPSIYAYADGTPVRVLTEGDKTEIINLIDEAVEPDTITKAEIYALFNKTI